MIIYELVKDNGRSAGFFSDLRIVKERLFLFPGKHLHAIEYELKNEEMLDDDFIMNLLNARNCFRFIRIIEKEPS